MDGFLGTSIQYSEQQILLLEQEHAADLQKTVEELIESGFLDSDYEDSTESEMELTDTEDEEIKENITFSSYDSISMPLQLFNDSNMNISPRTSNTNTLSPQTYTNYKSNKSNNCDLIEFKPFEYLFDRILSDIKSLMILFILILALPNIINDTNHTHDNNNNINDDIYGGTHYECRYHGHNHNHNNYIHETSIFWFYDTSPHNNKKRILNEEEDERDEYDNNSQCNNRLIFDIMTTFKDINTNKIFSAKLTHHKFIINKNIYKKSDKNNQYMQPLILSFGTNKKSNEMIKIVKEILSDTYGKQFVRTRGLFALIMSFLGIAAFAQYSYSSIDRPF